MSSLRVGLVGAGHISASHIAGWKRARGCRLVAIHDRDREAAAQRAGGDRGVAIADNVDAVIADADIVDVCTPPQSHAEIAHAVIAAGRHLLIEKPVVTNLDDWRSLRAELGNSLGRICVVHNIKFQRSIQKALGWVREGRIGRPLRLHREFLTHPTTDRMLVADGHWSHGLPGGRWFETLPHALYLTHAFIGPLELSSVTAQATPRAPSGAQIDEVAISLSGAGAIATIHYSAHCTVNRRQLTLVGEEGVIEVDVLGDGATLLRGLDARWKRPWTTVPRDTCARILQWLPDRLAYLTDRARGLSPHARIIEGFARHLQGQGDNPTSLEEIDYVVRMSQRVGSAIEAAARG